MCQRGAGRNGAEAGRGPAADVRKVTEGNELFRDGPLDTLGALCTGTQKANASKNGRNGRFWDRENEGELRRLRSRSILPFCPWHPLPFSPHPVDLHSSFNPLGRTGGSGHTCTAGLPVLPRRQHQAQPWQARRAPVPRMSARRGIPRHRACQEKRACCSSVRLEEALRPSLLEAGNGKSDSKNPQQGHHECTIFRSLFPGSLRHRGVPSFVSFSPNVRHFTITFFFFFTVPHNHT